MTDVQQFTKIAEARDLDGLEQALREKLSNAALEISLSSPMQKWVVLERVTPYTKSGVGFKLIPDITVSVGSRRGGKVYIAKMKMQ